jgi:hypothetical protein
MNLLNSKLHGIIDYIVVAFLWLSPSIFDFPQYTSWFTYAIGGVHFLLTIFTNFKFGIIKIVPLNVHGRIELLVSIVLVPLAFYLGSIDGSFSKIFYLLFAVAVFVTWFISDYTVRKKFF